jgi:hypothetical protein
MTSDIADNDIDIVVWTNNNGSAIITWSREGGQVKQEQRIYKLASLQLISVETVACW